MTPDPTNPRHGLEASLTALLLGELPPDQAAFLRQAIATDPELARMYARLERTINLVRETAAEPAPQPAAHPQTFKLSSERREQLLQRFKTVNHPVLEKPERRERSWLMSLSIAAAFILLFGWMLLPKLASSKSKSQLGHGYRTWSLDNIGNDEAAAPTRAPENSVAPSYDHYSLSGQVGTPPAVATAPPPTTIFLPPKLPESELSLTAKALDRSSAGNMTLSGGGFGGGGGGAGDAPPGSLKQGEILGTHSIAPAQEEALLRRYGLAAAAPGGVVAVPKAEEGRTANEPAEHAVAVDPTTGLPVSAGTLATDPTTGLPLPQQEGAKERLMLGLPMAQKPPESSQMARRAGVAGSEIYRGISVETNGRIEMRPVLPEVAQQQAANTTPADGNGPPVNLSYAARAAQGTARIDPTTGLPNALSDEERARFNNQLSMLSPGAPKAAGDVNLGGIVQPGWSDKEHQKNGGVLKVDGASQLADNKDRRLDDLDALYKAQAAAPAEKPMFGDTPVAGTMFQPEPKGAPVDKLQELAVNERIGRQTVPPGREPARDVERIDGLARTGALTSTNYLSWQFTADLRGFYDDSKAIPAELADATPHGSNAAENARLYDDAKAKNAVTQSYRGYRLEQRKKPTEEGIVSLQARLTENEQKIREAQTNVDYLRTKNRVSDYMAGGTPPTVLMMADTLRRIESLRIESQEELVRQQELLNKLNSMKNDPDRLAEALPTSGIQDQLLGTLREQRSLAEQRLASVQAQYGPENAETKKVAAQVEDLKSKINQRVAGDLSGLETRVASLGQSLTDLQQEVEKATRSDLEKASKTQPYWEAKAKLEALQRARAAMVQKTDEPRPPKPATPPPEPQPEIQTHDNAFSTFSLNVSDVSFKLAGASLEKGVLPEAASIRSEEFINAFDYRDPEPAPGAPIAFAWERARYPFSQNRDLLRFSLKTAALGRQAGRPLNLVLVLDNSGSMERADRVDIIREALRVLARQLQPQDTLSVVLFARTPRLWVDGVSGNQAGKVADEISGLTPEGGTNLGEALDLAYQTALRHYLMAGINRVVLLTDGAANLGNVEPEELKKKVEANRKQGVALDCFGIGWEGYNDDLLEVLTRNGDGRYGFINTPEEAATEFAGQLAGALHVAASDVKVQVEFNPKRVTAYRQIGYAKHQLTKEQFRDNSVDAAELGAAESGNALYVVDVNGGGDGPLATVRVRYKVPGTMQYQEHEWTVPYTGNAGPLEQASPALRLGASASAFSEWLATSPYAADVTPDSVLGYLRGVPEVYGADARPKKLEWMIRQAKSLVGR